MTTAALNVSWWSWVAFIAFIVALLALDLFIFDRGAHRPRLWNALALTAFFVAIALAFAGGLFALAGPAVSLRFITGYVLEKSLSLDNIFVFLVIFGGLGVPARYQHRVLFWGILGALALRGAFIAVGATLVERFDWVMYLFGALLVFSGSRLLVRGDVGPRNPKDSRAFSLLQRHLSLTAEYHGRRFFVAAGETRCATPLLVALVLIEISDIMFAIDSIPAVFAVTTDPFIVYTSNVFAILGLRALYFVLRDIIERFRYLKKALSVILVLVGAKMLASGVVALPVWITLAVTLTMLAGGLILSLIRGTTSPEPGQKDIHKVEA